MSPISLVVLISGNGSNLQAIIDQIENGYLNAEIKCVISNRPDVFGLERAKKHNIKSLCIDHTQFNSREEYDAELITAIKPLDTHYIILAGFMRILTAPFFQQFNHQIINIHPSLLPKYQGLHTHKRALENNDSLHGISVHIATEELDSGPVIAQASFALKPDDSIESLKQTCHKLEHILYPLVIQWMASKRLDISSGDVFFDHKKRTNPLMLDQIADNELPKIP